MRPHDLQTRIGTAPLLSGMSDPHVELLASCAWPTHFSAGDVIFRQGETANRFYLIEQGCVQLEAALESGERRVVAGTIESGRVLGWAWLFEPYEWQFTARALAETTAVFFYGTVLREHCEEDPSLGYALFKRMSSEMVRRLQTARNRLLEAESRSNPVVAVYSDTTPPVPTSTPAPCSAEKLLLSAAIHSGMRLDESDL